MRTLFWAFISAAFSLSSMAQIQFDYREWANQPLAQVGFVDYKTFPKAPPQGMIRIKDLSNVYESAFLDQLPTDQLRANLELIYPYAILAKSLDAWTWNKDPSQFYTPKELQDYVREFLWEQIAAYKQVDRATTSNQQLFQLLLAEIAGQEFSLRVTWPWCEQSSMKKVCLSLKLRLGEKSLQETVLLFRTVPENFKDFDALLSQEVEAWYGKTRRISALQELSHLAEAKIPKYKKLSEEQRDKFIQETIVDLLWSKVGASPLGDFCAFPELVCNSFNPQSLVGNMSDEQVDLMLNIRLVDQD